MKQQLNVRIPKELNEQLRDLSYQTRKSKTEIVTNYIIEGIKRETNTD